MEELIDFMTTAKMEHKEYEKMADCVDDEEQKNMYDRLAQNEKEAYEIMKDYIMSVVEKTNGV